MGIFLRWWDGKSPAKVMHGKPAGRPAEAGTLAAVRPGQQACLKDFAPGMPVERWAHLQAYGLTPGCLVRVVQHSPVTVVQVEQTELALESDLARQIRVT